MERRGVQAVLMRQCIWFQIEDNATAGGPDRRMACVYFANIEKPQIGFSL
jgi:hypothetical protein